MKKHGVYGLREVVARSSVYYSLCNLLDHSVGKPQETPLCAVPDPVASSRDLSSYKSAAFYHSLHILAFL